MSTYQFDHIHLNSPDALKTAQFYEKMFGSQIVRVTRGGTVVRLDLNGQQTMIGPPVGSPPSGTRDTAASIRSDSFWFANR